MATQKLERPKPPRKVPRRVAFEIGDELHARLRAEAIARSSVVRQWTMSDIIRELLAERLGQG